MPDKLFISKKFFNEMISHCRENYPNEACGILAGKNKEVSKIYKMTNIEKSPVSYEFDSTEHIKTIKDMRENGLSMVAIFHSHPSSPAYPSSKDVNLASYDAAVYVIVSLIEKEPVVKGFSIKEEDIKEVGVVLI